MYFPYKNCEEVCVCANMLFRTLLNNLLTHRLDNLSMVIYRFALVPFYRQIEISQMSMDAHSYSVGNMYVVPMQPVWLINNRLGIVVESPAEGGETLMGNVKRDSILKYTQRRKRLKSNPKIYSCHFPKESRQSGRLVIDIKESHLTHSQSCSGCLYWTNTVQSQSIVAVK